MLYTALEASGNAAPTRKFTRRLCRIFHVGTSGWLGGGFKIHVRGSFSANLYFPSSLGRRLGTLSLLASRCNRARDVYLGKCLRSRVFSSVNHLGIFTILWFCLHRHQHQEGFSTALEFLTVINRTFRSIFKMWFFYVLGPVKRKLFSTLELITMEKFIFLYPSKWN